MSAPRPVFIPPARIEQALLLAIRRLEQHGDAAALEAIEAVIEGREAPISPAPRPESPS